MADSVARVFQIIEYLAGAKDWVSLREMARELHISPASAYRALNSLKDIGYVRQHPQDGTYQLTLKMAWISAQLLENVQLRQIAHPFLQELTSATNETTHLAVLEGTEFVYIDKVDNAQAVRMRSRVGQRGRLHCTAVGKAMLAFLPEAEREAALQHLQFQTATEHTLTDAAAFRQELQKVRTLGYAVDDEENEVGIRCVGAPIYDHTGRLTAAVSVSGWTITMTPERIPGLAPQLVRTCRRISAELGFGGNNSRHAQP